MANNALRVGARRARRRTFWTARAPSAAADLPPTYLYGLWRATFGVPAFQHITPPRAASGGTAALNCLQHHEWPVAGHAFMPGYLHTLHFACPRLTPFLLSCHASPYLSYLPSCLAACENSRHNFASTLPLPTLHTFAFPLFSLPRHMLPARAFSVPWPDRSGR